MTPQQQLVHLTNQVEELLNVLDRDDKINSSIIKAKQVQARKQMRITVGMMRAQTAAPKMVKQPSLFTQNYNWLSR